MRRVWFWAIALLSFLFVVGESFLRKAIAVSLCGILSFNSTFCYANFAKNSGELAVASVPPTEQTQSTTPTLDFSPYLQSTRPEFEQLNSIPAKLPTYTPQNLPGNSDRLPQVEIPNLSQFAQSQPNLAGVWLYSIYRSSSDNKPIYRTAVEIVQSGNE